MINNIRKLKRIQVHKKISLLLFLALICFSTMNFKQYPSGMGVGLRWFTDKVSYHIDKYGSDDIPDDSEFVAIHNSFETWNAIDCGEFTFKFGGYVQGIKAGHNKSGENYNLLIWIDDPDEWTKTKDMNVIAMTTLTFDKFIGEIVDADMEMNDFKYEFTTTNDPKKAKTDVKNTVTHEIGHMLGLDHSDVKESTMYFSSPTGDLEKRTLHEDDIAGFCYIYDKPVVPDFSEDSEPSEDAFVSDGSPLPYGGNGCGFGARNETFMLFLLFGLIVILRSLYSKNTNL
ncbi:MAG: matrixin family metalloprotease [Deltaproteobacteria bacterium]|nr:matrixin family metalloprotease [Deltaproteobacteria bacterium]